MAGIFISHSSKNNAEAERLREWLEQQGWGRSQVFLDLHDLKSGDRWRDVLNSMGDCEAVIVCLSNEWLGSSECIREFTQAEERGKVILPVFVARVTAPIPRFITDVQIGDTSPEGVIKLRDQLFAKRITPQSFPWPPKDEPDRSVYRGLQALDVPDAAVFFGRDADILRGLDEVRALRNGGPHRMLVILGASGAGKSSFLRAGLIARLTRDEESFLVLPIVRPGRAALSGAQGLAASAQFDGSSGADGLALAFAAARTPVIARLQRNAESRAETYAAKPPTIIIPIDQAEELFAAENTERDAFCAALTGAVEKDGNALIVATIRSDSYEALQKAPLLSGIGKQPFDLSPIPSGAFQEIIEGPARLAKPALTVEPALTQQLLVDLNAADALPLLAFTLERLRRQYGQDGAITLADYRDKLGGLSGAIQSAVNAVLGEQPSKGELARARGLFIPGLVRVEQSGVRKRVARQVDLPDTAKDLIDQFVQQRLLVLGDGTVEIAHEAMLRQWPLLANWIANEQSRLDALRNLEASAASWWAGRRRGVDLNHRGSRLREVKVLLKDPSYRPLISGGGENLKYVNACTWAARRRFWRNALLVAGGLFALAAGEYAFYEQRAAVLEATSAASANRASAERDVAQFERAAAEAMTRVRQTRSPDDLRVAFAIIDVRIGNRGRRLREIASFLASGAMPLDQNEREVQAVRAFLLDQRQSLIENLAFIESNREAILANPELGSAAELEAEVAGYREGIASLTTLLEQLDATSPASSALQTDRAG
jgi:hypothetical protein